MGYQALLFCPDEKLARVVSQVFSELDFTVEPVNEPFAAVKKLMAHRYDAIVVDCENEQNAILLFKSARNSSSNQSSLALALVEGQAGVAKAYRIGANLVLTKPINVEHAKGTLRVARGLLRKNLDAAASNVNPASPAAPPKAAPMSADSSIKPASQSAEPPAPTQSKHALPEFESPLPAMAASLAVENTAIAAPASEALTKVSAEAESPAQTRHQVSPSEPPSPAPVPPAPFKSPASTHAGGHAAAAAPAPAREAPAPAPKKAAAPEFEAPAEAVSTTTTSTTYVGGPSFAALGEDSGGSGGSKKILVVAAVLLAVAALGYFGWTTLGKTSTGSHPVSAPQQPVPAPSSAPATSVSPVPPSASAPDPAASTSQSATLQSAKPSATIISAPAIKIGGEPEPVAKKAEPAPIVVKSYAAGKKVQAPGEEPAPIPSPLAVATANEEHLSGLMSSGTANLPKAMPATLRISQGVSQGLLIKRVQPRYPQNALAMRIQGAVQMEATINKEGNIINLKVLNGDAVLARAATEAVRQWRYKPYYLDGDPVEIQTQITVNFKLPN
ncbi:MAG: TonB family protein [Acidobacteriales bacterium]|nr:TonB family protein [Terriglobales bacterium]